MTNMRHELNLATRTAGRFDKGHFEGKGRIFRIEGSENRAGYGIGGWDETGEGRLVMHGPMVKGPHAYLFGLAGVIDQSGGTGAEHARAVAEGRMIDAKDGDLVSINGIEFALTVDARGYPHLAPTTCRVCQNEPASEDGVCRWESCEKEAENG